MPRLFVLPLLALLLFAACDEGPQPAPLTEEDLAEEPLYVEPIGFGQRSLLADTTRVLVRDSVRWATLRDSLRPQNPFTPVDFSQAMVALVAVPVRSGGYDVTIGSVIAVDSTIRIEYTLTRPGEDCLTAYSPSTPFHAVLIRRTAGTPVFEQRVETANCTTGPW